MSSFAATADTPACAIHPSVAASPASASTPGTTQDVMSMHDKNHQS